MVHIIVILYNVLQKGALSFVISYNLYSLKRNICSFKSSSDCTSKFVCFSNFKMISEWQSAIFGHFKTKVLTLNRLDEIFLFLFRFSFWSIHKKLNNKLSVTLNDLIINNIKWATEMDDTNNRSIKIGTRSPHASFCITQKLLNSCWRQVHLLKSKSGSDGKTISG